MKEGARGGGGGDKFFRPHLCALATVIQLFSKHLVLVMSLDLAHVYYHGTPLNVVMFH
jgi:hypothetical protein